jgi:hypothetical protein
MIRTVHEPRRRCGYRQPGGYYLMSGSLGTICGKLPKPVRPCAECGKLSVSITRGWSWFNAREFFGIGECHLSGSCSMIHLADSRSVCLLCILCAPPERAGLVWVGAQFYPTIWDFTQEAARLGLSKRLPGIPEDFKAGETWVAIGHRGERVWTQGEETHEAEPRESVPIIFRFFQPSRIEYVVTDKETPDELIAIEAKGAELVRVIPSDTLTPYTEPIGPHEGEE